MTVPSWVQDSVFYQIFPDRFANGDKKNDPPNVQRWGTKPSQRGFMGGDLAGVIQKFDYLLDLGINAIYLNPIFAAASNHRYDARDYFQIDPKVGDLPTFQKLIRLAHRSGVRVILDGVFNHCGRGFFAFSDLVENENASPYHRWFHVKKFPLNPYGEGEYNYECWWNIKSLPKFNTRHTPTRRYLLDVARYWIEQGADGWRLDVPGEIKDDEFWSEFRAVVRKANPQAYTLGEIWEVNPRWVGNRKFDALMNYPFRTAALKFFANDEMDAIQFGDAVEGLLTVYPRPHVYAQFNLLGSHDTERFLTLCHYDVARLKLALLFQFTYVGAPSIYYGDEIGLIGGKDPDCRRAFEWNKRKWDVDLHDYVKTLVSLRHKYPTLRRGIFKPLLAKGNLYAFMRRHENESLIIILNNSDSPLTFDFSTKQAGWLNTVKAKDLLSGQKFDVEGQSIRLNISKRAGMILKSVD